MADYIRRFSKDMTLIDQILPLSVFTTTFGKPVYPQTRHNEAKGR
jgi:hypothetical protein